MVSGGGLESTGSLELPHHRGHRRIVSPAPIGIALRQSASPDHRPSLLPSIVTHPSITLPPRILCSVLRPVAIRQYALLSLAIRYSTSTKLYRENVYHDDAKQAAGGDHGVN